MAGVLGLRPRENYVRAFGPDRAAIYATAIEKLFPDTKGRRFPTLRQDDVIPHAAHLLTLVQAALADSGPGGAGEHVPGTGSAGAFRGGSDASDDRPDETPRPSTDDGVLPSAWLPRFGPEARSACAVRCYSTSPTCRPYAPVGADGRPATFLYGTRFWIVPLFAVSETDAALTDAITGLGAREDDLRAWEACARFRRVLLGLPGTTADDSGVVTFPLTVVHASMSRVQDAVVQLARELGSP